MMEHIAAFGLGVLATFVVVVVTSDPVDWRSEAAAWQQHTAQSHDMIAHLLTQLMASRRETAECRADAMRLQCACDFQQQILHDTEATTLPVLALPPDMSLELLATHTWTGDELN